ncbi:unnamed protein product [Parnassius mnemosyne]|uniref:MADF domain-containing protein n=1 Tax=Parnassius mnemosyne TaxID=213953 RepID=A0AAV1LEQ2_9NEOP
MRRSNRCKSEKSTVASDIVAVWTCTPCVSDFKMADLRKYSRAFVTEFIELYQELPSLWMVKSKDYSNRDLKSQSYEILVGKFKEVEPNADRDFVIKKIKDMRDVWRKQHEKIEKSLKSGMAVEDIPTPSLWYYDLLNFLKDQETTRSSITNIKIGNKDRVK